MSPHGNLALLRPEDVAFYAHNVPNVRLLKTVVGLRRRHLILTDVELNPAGMILKVTKHHLAHAPFAHDAAGQGDGLSLHLRKVVLDFCAAGIPFIFRLGKGVHSIRLKLRQLLPANPNLIAQRHL